MLEIISKIETNVESYVKGAEDLDKDLIYGLKSFISANGISKVIPDGAYKLDEIRYAQTSLASAEDVDERRKYASLLRSQLSAFREMINQAESN